MNSQIVSSKKRFPLVVCLVLAGLLFVMAIIVVVLFGNPTVAFSIQLDGKSLPLGVIPAVTMNGKPFHSGDKLSVGHNSLSIVLNNAEPISRSVWTWWGENNLGSISLNTLKGNLSITTTPSAATFALRQGSDSIRSGITPATLNDVPAGDYDVMISRGSYKEGRAVIIVKGETASLNLNLKIANILLESSPTDADFTLTGNGNKWEGKLPTVISNVTFGNYTCTSSRKGWNIVSSITVDRTGGLTNLTEFPYGSIEATSDPTGLTVSTNGIEIGKTPLTIHEVKPGQYTLAVSDGENDLLANLSVGPMEAAKHAFVFHYGAVQLSSTPPGATVVRKGKEVGKTPLALNHIPIGESSVELRLHGYASTNFIVGASEGATANLSVKLISEQYLQAMKKAHETFGAGQFDQSQKFLLTALEIQPNDSPAMEFRDEVSKASAKAEEASRAEQANVKAQKLASLTWLDFQKVISDCTDTKLVKYPVSFNDGYYDNSGKFHKTGQHTEMQTRTEHTFNPITFSAKYEGRTFGFNCPDKWSVSKVENDGGIILKEARGLLGSDVIRVTASTSNPEALKSLQKGQKVTIKAVLTKCEPGVLVRTLYLADAEILDK
jgi:hypothetical protein